METQTQVEQDELHRDVERVTRLGWEPPDWKRPFRFLRRRWIASLSVLVALLFIGAISFIANYNPLSEGHTGWHPVGCLKSNDELYSPTGERFRLIELQCDEPGTTARWGSSIENEGRFGVTVLAVGQLEMGIFANSEVRLGSSVDAVGGNDPINPSEWESTPSFAPFELAAGDERPIFFGSVLNRCEGDSFITGVPVTFKFLGFTRHEQMPWMIKFTCANAVDYYAN